MDKKGYEKLNEILGLEIIDSKSNIILENTDHLIEKILSFIEKPDAKIKNNCKYLLYLINSICWNKGIYLSSLHKINKAQGTQDSFSNFQIPIFNVTDSL